MEYKTIGESCTLHARIGWQGLTKSEYLDEGDYYLVTGVDFDNGRIAFDSCHFVTKERYDQDQHIQLKQGDVLVTKDGTIGKVAYIDTPIDKPATLNSGVFVVRPKDSSVLLPEYLMIMLMSNHFYRFIEQIKVGCTIAHLNQEKFLRYQFPLPSVAEQKHIIEVYYSATEIVKKSRRQLATLDDLIKARFVEMFGEPIDNPMRWPVVPLKSISVLITNGNTPKGGSENYVNEGIMFLRSQNVWRNRIELDDVAFIDEATHASMKKSSLHYKDILITKTGRVNTENSSLGRAALYTGENNAANINGHVYLVRLDDTAIPEYVVTILTGEAYRKYIRKVCVGGIDKRQINVDQVEDFPIIMPPMHMQKEFAKFREQVDKSKFVWLACQHTTFPCIIYTWFLNNYQCLEA